MDRWTQIRGRAASLATARGISQLQKPGEFPLEYFYFLLNQETRLYEESELKGGGGKELVLSRGWK